MSFTSSFYASFGIISHVTQFAGIFRISGNKDAHSSCKRTRFFVDICTLFMRIPYNHGVICALISVFIYSVIRINCSGYSSKAEQKKECHAEKNANTSYLHRPFGIATHCATISVRMPKTKQFACTNNVSFEYIYALYIC